MYKNSLNYFLLLLCFIFISSRNFADELKMFDKEWKAKETILTPELRNLDRTIERLQLALKDISGIEDLYICGGSAPAILDHIYRGVPLKMRDLDIVIIINDEVNGRDIQQFAYALENHKVGHFLTDTFKTRPRAPQGWSILADTEYNAGFGFYLTTPDHLILDLSFFFYPENIHLNGLMNVDTTKILIRKGESLEKFVAKAKTFTFDDLNHTGDIIDHNQGYQHWVEKNPEICNWIRVEADPLLHLFRLVHTLVKMRMDQFPETTWKDLHNAVASAKPIHVKEMSEHLLRTLHNEKAAVELKLLQDFGLFNQWIPAFGEKLKDMSIEEIAQFVENPLLSSKEKFKLLINTLPKEQQLITLFSVLSEINLNEAVEWCIQHLADEKILDNHVLHHLLNQINDHKQALSISIQRILTSKVLSKEDPFALCIRSIVRLFPNQNSQTLISSLFPHLSQKTMSQLLKIINTKRKGVMTGTFDPIQNGSIGVLRTAIEQLVLDEVLLVPIITERAGHPITSWEDRCNMITIATKDIPEVSLTKAQDLVLLEKGKGIFMDHYRKNIPSDTIVYHIMGSDAFERFEKLPKIEEYLVTKNYLLFIVYRPGHPFPKDIKDNIICFHQEKSSSVSSNEVRNLARVQRPIFDFVPSTISEYIAKHYLYTRDSISSTPIFLIGKDIKLLKVVQKHLASAQLITEDISYLTNTSAQEMIENSLKQALNFGYNNVISIERSLEIATLDGLPGINTKEWIKKMRPQTLQNLLKESEKIPAVLSIIVGYAHSPNEKIYFNVSVHIDLALYLQKVSFQWESLFLEPLSESELSLTDQALSKFVHYLLYAKDAVPKVKK